MNRVLDFSEAAAFVGENGTEQQVLTIGVVGGDRRTREFHVYLLEATHGFRVVGDWLSVESLLTNGSTEPPDLLLLEVQLPGMSGVEGLTPLRQRFPRTTVLLLTAFDDEETVFEALCCGADGYLLKNTEPARLLRYIHEAAAGGAPMSPEIARKVVGRLRKLAPARHAGPNLTTRQVRLLGLLADGHSYKSIARNMNVSINTIRTYIRILYQKLHVRSRSAAVAEALRGGVI